MTAEEIIFFKLFLYPLRTTNSGRVWWLKSANPVLRKLRQEDCFEPKARLGYIEYARQGMALEEDIVSEKQNNVDDTPRSLITASILKARSPNSSLEGQWKNNRFTFLLGFI